DLSHYDHLQKLKLADPTVNDDKEIDLLLGVAEFGRIVNNGLVKGADDAPIAMNSEVGWLIMGPQRDNDKKTTIKITSLILNSEIENKIDKFFASETMGSVDGDCSQLSDEEKYCEENYLKTTRRNEEEYTIAMHDDIARGYMVLVENPPRDAYYIPHHAVFKDSTTTKLRTVYNASQKTSNGLSLNEQLAIVIIADLEKMYKQIRIEEIQQKLQMILWRDSSDENIKTYKLTTVTFGVAPSPFLAIRTLREIASVVENEFPNAAQSIRDCFYVDDHVGGVDTVEQAVELYNQLKTVFDRFGFNLRKFVSNSSEFLNKIPNSEKEEVNSVKKVLGVTWQPKTDELTFKIPFELESKPKTKRQLLSEIATLYDPMGYLAPIVVKAKLIMQEVWMLSNK
ncbi:uncharacterized protein LOC129568854, partial [Sitodiplosis mosellana]|uniref:uncharacterized protein LOC129568854 n=1 Tax=Sitodiplosis mosellana TaxID=263140 RepID=UPI002444E6E0